MRGDFEYLKERPHYLYILKDPFDFKIKYVGVTYDIKGRKYDHFTIPQKDICNDELENWLNYLRFKNTRPIYEIIKKFSNKKDALKMEAILISNLRGEVFNKKL